MDNSAWFFIALAILAVIGIAVVATALVIHNYRIERWAANEQSRPRQEDERAKRTRPGASGYRRPSGSQSRASAGTIRDVSVATRNNVPSRSSPSTTSRAKFGKPRATVDNSVSHTNVSNQITERRTCPVCDEMISQRDYRSRRVMICKCDTHYHLSPCYQKQLGSVCPICSRKGN